MNTFKVGQTVCHLSHGIGVIKSVEAREFSPGKENKFYILEIEDAGAPKKVFVPVENAEARLRKIISKTEAQMILDYIETATPDCIDDQTWNRRYRDYMERIHSGDAMEIAKVYLALKGLQAAKDLSFGERKLLEQAAALIKKEVEAAGLECNLDNAPFKTKLTLIRGGK